MCVNEIRGASFLVFGSGRSGLAAAEFFAATGGQVRVFDQREIPSATAEILGNKGISCFSGDENFSALLPVDFVVRSPAVRPDHPLLRLAREKGARVDTETGFFASLCPARLFAVTGSDGKTTTATLLAEALRMGGHRVFLGGNIGQSLLPALADMKKEDFAVLELSSFQLMDMTFRALGGIVTNLTPNHLNWHTDMAEYAGAKRRVLLFSDRAVARAGVFPDLPALRFSAEKGAKGADIFLRDGVIYDREGRLFSQSDMFLAGLHNVENLMAAAGLAAPYVPRSVFPALAASFRGVAHRMELVGRHGDTEFFDSSIDTTPYRTGATLAALAGRGRRPVVLLGGAAKGLSFFPLRLPLIRYASSAVLFGAAAARLAEALDGIPVPLYRESDLAAAFSRATALAEKKARCVLLSPACTSFDTFRDYEERGDFFRALVRAL